MAVSWNSKSHPQRVLLTVDDVEEWQKQADRLRAEISEREAAIKAINAKLDAARLLIGDADQHLFRQADETSDRSAERAKILRPMTAVIDEMFANTEKRLHAASVLAALSLDAEQGARVKDNPNNVYTALSRLAARGVLRRHEDGSYSRAVETNEPPNGRPAGGSNVREGSDPSLFTNP